MEEIWKHIHELDDLYLVSNFGRIKGLKREYFSGPSNNTKKIIEERIVHQKINNKGYAYCSLSVNGKIQQFFVHRMVALYFVPGRTEENNIVNHKDGNPLNNYADNLEWCNQKYNLNYGDRSKKFIETMNTTKKWLHPPKRVRCYFHNKLLAEFPSVHSAAKFYGIDDAAIRNTCNAKTKKCLYLDWKYVNDNEKSIIFAKDYMEKLKQIEQERLELIRTHKYKCIPWDAEFEALFAPVYEKWLSGEITGVGAAKKLGISRQAFIRRTVSYPEYLEFMDTMKNKYSVLP